MVLSSNLGRPRVNFILRDMVHERVMRVVLDYYPRCEILMSLTSTILRSRSWDYGGYAIAN